MSKVKQHNGYALKPPAKGPRAGGAADDERGETVVCFLSGKRVPRHLAVRVKLGPGERVWMLAEYCRDG
jgi:hypothetical protein